MTDLPDDLPEDADALKKLVLKLAAERDDVFERLKILEHRYKEEMRKKYGRTAETIDPNQMQLFLEQAVKEVLEGESEPTAEVTSKEKPKGHGRRKPVKELMRRPVIQDVEEHEKICSRCTFPREQCGRTVTLQLDYVPGYAFYWEFIRLKYACRACEGSMVTAPKPEQPIERGMPAAGMLAHIATARFADHLPYYRQEGIFRRQGLELSRSTMVGWMADVAQLLQPIYQFMISEIKNGKVIWTDDTPIRVLDKKLEKGTKQGRIWVYRGDREHPHIVFHYTPSRRRDGPVEFLQNYKGYMQADAFAGYDCIYVGGAVQEVACWAHARRKFFELRDAGRPAFEVLELIEKLYAVERQYKSSLPEERLQARGDTSAPLLLAIKDKLDLIVLTSTPRSLLRGAANYALNNWQALNVFTTDGDLTIDNNLAENAIRPIALGRKNWLFAGSDSGGETNAVISSFISTCRRIKIDPFAYIRTAIMRLTENPKAEPNTLVPGVLELEPVQ